MEQGIMELSVAEQSPRSRNIYTQLCFCYPFPDDASQTEVIEMLTRGLERLTAGFPWLAGKVINENAGEDKKDFFKVVPFERIPRLAVTDITSNDSAPTMAALREAKFPFSMLEEKLLCPRMTIAGGPGETLSDPFPVLVLQANFITGGLLLTIAASHSVLDIAGQGQMIRLLSKACGNEPFTEEEMINGNLDRRYVFPLFDDSWKPDPEPSKALKSAPSQPSSGGLPTTPCPFTWAYFTFEPASLTALRAHAASSIPIPTTFVSTDDVLSALIWQSIVRARLTRLDPLTDSIFTRAVDLRRFFDVPDTYPGNMVTKTTHTSTLQKLADVPLGIVSSQLRSALNRDTLKYDTQAQVTLQSRTRDKSVNSSSDRDRTKYIVMSSWSKVDCYGVNFNLGLGPPESVRRPQFVPVEGVVYLLPKAPDGEIVAGLCLRDDDMEKLKLDEDFVRYGQYIG